MSKLSKKCLKAIYHVMQYEVATPERCLVLASKVKWDGSRNYNFEISAKLDLDCVNDPDTRRSIMGVIVYFENALVVYRSTLQKTIALFITEAEFSVEAMPVQDIMFIYCMITLLGLKVRLLMKAFNLANS